ncbi:tripartite tricarboxylate transporter TctB family protein [Pararhodobacter sp.]|uniref:tripartite tricarboxylate transporter TctB family protein n=1 Tax=Pararhodobacter sp. TaxID=2127056 RepID=UPI002AFF6339|nr:tripartite tricarboxylate transporter TctB family protein [Pararhodobacter sp.]
MPSRFHLAPTHAVLMALVLAASGFIVWSATSASTRLTNLIVVVPVGAVLVLAMATILFSAWRKPTHAKRASSADIGAATPIWGDVILLAGFAVFCLAMTRVGFDIATFFFVWAGVTMSGGKGLWQPPLFALIFTLLITYGFGSLFPYPLPTLVL